MADHNQEDTQTNVNTSSSSLRSPTISFNVNPPGWQVEDINSRSTTPSNSEETERTIVDQTRRGNADVASEASETLTLLRTLVTNVDVLAHNVRTLTLENVSLRRDVDETKANSTQ